MKVKYKMLNSMYYSWLVGLLEGEAYFSNMQNGEPFFELEMKDEDVVHKVATLLENVNVYSRKRKSWSKTYRIKVTKDKARYILEDIYPFMSKRRRESISKILYQIPENKRQLNEFMWLVGILEAEGSFMKGPPSKPNQPRISIEMTDYDVLEKVSSIFNIKIQKGVIPKKENHKQSYRVVIKGLPSIKWMLLLKPFMGQRRQEQIENVINTYTYKIGSKLKIKDVKTIKKMINEGYSNRFIGDKFKVDSGTIRHIRVDNTWKEI